MMDGAQGNDGVFGQDGHDELYGGSGNDFVQGGFGADKLFGETGDDTLIADDNPAIGDFSKDRLDDTEGTNSFYYEGLLNIDIIVASGPNDTLNPH